MLTCLLGRPCGWHATEPYVIVTENLCDNGIWDREERTEEPSLKIFHFLLVLQLSRDTLEIFRHNYRRTAIKFHLRKIDRWSNALHNSPNNANLKSLTLVLSPGKLRLRTAKKQQGRDPSSLRLNSAPAPITPSLGVSSPFLTFTSLCIITGWIILDL